MPSLFDRLLDIALKGVLLENALPLPLALGTVASLALPLPGSEIVLNFDAELVHREEHRLEAERADEGRQDQRHEAQHVNDAEEVQDQLGHLGRVVAHLEAPRDDREQRVVLAGDGEPLSVRREGDRSRRPGRAPA